MRVYIAVAIAFASLLPATIETSEPVAAQTIGVQYGGDDGYGGDYDDPYGDDAPSFPRGRYGRDDGYRSDDRGDDRDDDYDRQRSDDRRYQEQGRNQPRYLNNDDRQRDVVVKRLTKQDKRCLRKHSTYDPETGTYSDGRGGRKRCKG